MPRNHVLVILDSCRFDTFVEARPRFMTRLGEVERRYSYASWTAPAHYNLLTGLLPHRSPTHVYASEVYKDDFRAWGRRLGLDALSFTKMIPRLWLPHTLRQHGYATHARVSLPVLNPETPLAVDFDSFELMERHNDLRAMLPILPFPSDQPSFVLLNVGETHYPYATPDEPESDWPVIHGLHGIFKQSDPQLREGHGLHHQMFDEQKLAALRQRQVEAVRHVDRVMEELFDLLPTNTWVTITSDHGELFGEGGYMGHGPIHHPLVWEVPFVEGLLR